MACAAGCHPRRACRDLLSSSAALVRAGVETVELEEAPSDDRNGTRSASSADHCGVAGHVDGRGQPGAGGAGASRRGAPVRRAFPRPGARGGAGGDDGLEVRRRGAAPRRGDGASGGAGGDRGAAREQEAGEERPRGRAPSARAADGRAGCRSRGSRPITSSICVRGSGCVTRWSTSAASGSNGSRPCSITTGARSDAT